jgi:hypothetical protein
MDRYDEKKDRRDEDEVERTGDVLGLGGAAVPKSPGDPTSSRDRWRGGANEPLKMRMRTAWRRTARIRTAEVLGQPGSTWARAAAGRM